MIGAIIPQAQAIVSSAGIIKNILAGLVPKLSGTSLLEFLAKDIGGFEFNYIGEETLEAGADITDHYMENNTFFHDHKSVKPTIITCRGFVSELSYSKKGLLAMLSQLQTALTVVQPYQNRYAPGTAAKMSNVVSQADTIVSQLSSIANTANSVMKLVGILSKTECQKAYTKLEDLRQQDFSVAVVTPFKTFPDMFIENVRMVSPDDTRGWTDITVRLKEIRYTPSLSTVIQANARTGA